MISPDMHNQGLKNASAVMKAHVEAASETGSVVIVITIAEVLGSLTVAEGVTDDEEADLLASILDVACTGITTTGPCTVMWKNDVHAHRRLRLGGGRSLADVSLAYAVSITLDGTNPVVPTVSTANRSHRRATAPLSEHPLDK